MLGVGHGRIGRIDGGLLPGIDLDMDESLRLEATEEAHTLVASEIALAQLLIMLQDAYELVWLCLGNCFSSIEWRDLLE